MSALSFKQHGIIGVFTRHKVAANLVMVLMILLGVVALFKMNVQFFPSFNLDYAQVRVIWPGANAQDVESSVTDPVERVLRNIENLDEMTSTSSLGVSVVTLKFIEGTNMIEAVDQVRQRVSELRNLPQDIQSLTVERITRYEPVAKVLVLGQEGEEAQLRTWVRDFERDLLARGIDKVDFRGRPAEEMAIELDLQQIAHYGLGFDQVASQVAGLSRDLPAGRMGDSDSARDIRAIEQQRDIQGFADLPIKAGANEHLRLGDLAEISLRPVRDSAYLKVDGRPAIEMALQRAESGNTLTSSRIMQAWLDETQPGLPAGIELKVYDETWSLVKDRIMLLVKNGVGGLILVLLILYIFLNGRVALWVAIGIPVSFMATLMVLYLGGGSINMISLFGLIMALGIIVDDAIVVGEDALSHYEQGEGAIEAAEGGARRMFTPVMASSLTTIAAFLPLMLIGAEIGAILFAIPMVIVAVILVSLVQCFLVLPGHLRFGLSWGRKNGRPIEDARCLRCRWDRAFLSFRQNHYRRLIRSVLANRATTLAVAFGLVLLTVGLLAGGRLGFTFFPAPEGNKINASIQFVAGTDQAVTAKFVEHVYQALRDTEAALEPGLIDTAVVAFNQGSGGSGSVFGQVNVELIDPDRRHTRNATFVREWQARVIPHPGLENFNIVAQTGGPPGRDIQVQFSGAAPALLKQASLDFQQALDDIPGVSGVSDDLPFGREQLIFKMTPYAHALGFSYGAIGSQLSSAFSGRLAQIYTLGEDEIEVRVMLPRERQAQLAILNEMQLTSPAGQQVPLSTLVDWQTQQGFDVMRHYNGQLAVTVLGDVDRAVNNANRILAGLQQDVLPQIMADYGVSYSFEGTARNQQKTMADMLMGLLIGLVLIYIILAWVFESYAWPIIVMLAIPLGLVGAILGHYFLGIGLTLLSMFGFFGLAGIVVNNSIILVSFYKRLREEGMAINEALEEASVQRLRAVLVTTLTTVAGLTPLLFETSLQAQFLIPMAVSIAFGLLFATLLILLLIPVILSLYEGMVNKVSSKQVSA
ncbi:efflux RND transporter permease subunit [Thiomicrospira microaerophila]|uniref:efflux RND transporter permease subunit n=1 Tax=Thiomicrospira microaerophila TaxID=406020 RepID=UPI0005CB15D2|nr:efflux RND transporter permease subunit [Thiomicrospira microaerophila]